MGDTQRPREPVSSDPLLLTPEAAAEVLHVGRTTIYALMKAGSCTRCTSAAAAVSPGPSSNATSVGWKVPRRVLRLHRADIGEVARTKAACSSSPPTRGNELDLCIPSTWSQRAP